MSLETDIAGWGGASQDILRIYKRHCGRPSFGSDVVALLDQRSLERGATWLLKHHLETGSTDIQPADVDAVCSRLPDIDHWEARLHILQSIEHLPIPRPHLPKIEQFLREAVADDVKFVRAWGYHGWHQLAVQHPTYREQVSKILADALTSETAPSVKVRIRKALAAGF